MASTLLLLGAGLIFGLKHALDADHLVAVSTIAGESKSLVRSSMMVALPARLTVQRFSRAHVAVRMLAGLFSLGFGLLMAYQIGVVDGLLL